MSEPTLNPDSFDAAFSVLQANAAKLRNSNEMQIDDLLPIVEESTAAYKICKDRLERVRAALKQHLDGGAPGAAIAPPAAPTAPDWVDPEF